MVIPQKKLEHYNPNAVAGDSYIRVKNAEEDFFQKRLIVLVVLMGVFFVVAYLGFEPSSPPSTENETTPEAVVVATSPSAAVDQTGNVTPPFIGPDPFKVAGPPEAIALKYLRKDLPLPTPIEGLPPVPPELLRSIREVLDAIPEGETRSNLISEQDVMRISSDQKILAAALFTLLPELMSDAEFELFCTVFQRMEQSDFQTTALAIYPKVKFNLRKALLRVIGTTGNAASLNWLLERVVDEKNTSDSAVTRSVAYYVQKHPDCLFQISTKLDSPAIKRLTYMQILAHCGHESALEGTLQNLSYNDPDVKVQALNNLRNLGLRGRPIPRELTTLLKDDDIMVRKEAITTLAACKDFASIPLLIDHLNDKNRVIKEMVHWALKQMTGKEFPASSPDSWKEWWTAEASKFSTEIPRLLKELQAANQENRKAAFKSLAGYSRFLDAKALTAIRACLRDADPIIRVEACSFLVATRQPEAAVDLLNALNDSEKSVQNVARRGLSTLTGLPVPDDAKKLADFKRKVLEQIEKAK